MATTAEKPHAPRDDGRAPLLPRRLPQDLVRHIRHGAHLEHIVHAHEVRPAQDRRRRRGRRGE